MGTELKTNMTEHTLKRFWGGNDRGACLIISAAGLIKVKGTVEDQMQVEGYIQLTMEEAAALRNDLGKFIIQEAKRRQALLKEKLEELKIEEKAVFHEVADLPVESMYDTPELIVRTVSQTCPKFRKRRNPMTKESIAADTDTVVVEIEVSTKNESTQSPYWVVFDFNNLPDEFIELPLYAKTRCMYKVLAGPFFSREEAERYYVSKLSSKNQDNIVIGCSCAPAGCQYSRKVSF